ncbi:hypothetical protein [Streptomyces tsukubensis]|uniref:hypothetical protein n=1 Tax=Streptomyces tsukubensis TaxID=83656 RepID=UPI00344ECA15
MPLFLRGPLRQKRWHYTADLYTPGPDTDRYRASAPMTRTVYQPLTAELEHLGVITPAERLLR